MADPTKTFTDMFKSMGEQLKIPSFDMAKIMEHQQKNLEAMTRSWQAMAGAASEIAQKQRSIFEATMKDVTAMAQSYKPGGSPQEIMAKQAEFAKKAMEAAIANTRDIAELVQKSSTEAFRIVQDRMKESYDEIRASVEKKKP
jgi:phasin family protein